MGRPLFRINFGFKTLIFNCSLTLVGASGLEVTLGAGGFLALGRLQFCLLPIPLLGSNSFRWWLR